MENTPKSFEDFFKSMLRSSKAEVEYSEINHADFDTDRSVDVVIKIGNKTVYHQKAYADTFEDCYRLHCGIFVNELFNVNS